jgi:GTP-binding protein
VIDVPGLIEGASEGVGLGHDFLAHLERARILVHVIDAAAGDPLEQFAAIDAELAAYGAGLAERSQIVALNKIDLLPVPPGFSLDEPRVERVVRISCATGEGIGQLLHALFELCPVEPPVTTELGLPEFVEYRPRPERRQSFRILRTDRGYRVVGTPPSVDELEEALRVAGVRRGAEVELEGETLEWQ